MPRRSLRWGLVAAFMVIASGCANFQTTKAFATHGEKITTSVQAEFAFIDTECRQGSTVTALLLGQTDPEAVGRQARLDCQGMDESLARLAAATLDLLDQYDQAIASLSDGTKYDLSASFKSTAAKLEALETANGPVLREESVEIAARAASLLSQIATSAIRSRDMKRLLDAGGDDWPRILSPLETFFGPHPGDTSVQPSPYQTIVRSLDETDQAIVALLGRKLADGKGCISLSLQAVECEPLRATELIFEARTRRRLYVDRLSSDPARPSKTARAVQEAIDAWLKAHEALRQAAFTLPEDQLWALLQTLKTRAEALQAALAAARKD